MALLVAIYTVNFLDRQIINTIGESIKNDLHLTDSQMGARQHLFRRGLHHPRHSPCPAWPGKSRPGRG